MYSTIKIKEEMTNKIKKDILPLYELLDLKVLKENNYLNDICTFCFQWGENYPFAPKNGFLFVGKAVNGWLTNETNIEKLFKDPQKATKAEKTKIIFAREDQMEWVNNLSGNTNGYNTRKSAFWRLIRKVSETYYPEKWYSNIAWTNLYKVAPWKGGNPNEALQNIQREYCFKILKKEIEILSPKYVIFLTSGWEGKFVKYLNGGGYPNPIAEKIWGKYKTTLTEIDGTIYIFSQHPQGKNEWSHRNAIVELINENENTKNYT